MATPTIMAATFGDRSDLEWIMKCQVRLGGAGGDAHWTPQHDPARDARAQRFRTQRIRCFGESHFLFPASGSRFPVARFRRATRGSRYPRMDISPDSALRSVAVPGYCSSIRIEAELSPEVGGGGGGVPRRPSSGRRGEERRRGGGWCSKSVRGNGAADWHTRGQKSAQVAGVTGRRRKKRESPGPVTLLPNGMVVEVVEVREGMNGKDPARNLAMRSSSSIVVRVGIIPIMSVMAIVHRHAGAPFRVNMVWLFVFNALFNLDSFPTLISAVLFDATSGFAGRLFPS
ncbi:hypothetical protein AXG93_3817s1330 [Marchantia polymorpha subsp. ruderalis]|uniref:Uncharacterized protein n=1 Tax=Marchantia polymorpha subsp. ruderalis TaxID=1480154 RepID=A0A176W0H4_MARPO|nr:hypothetical protein AXG93_3817s1330 [Marchantia polymorpha subsp. ruderalis]